MRNAAEEFANHVASTGRVVVAFEVRTDKTWDDDKCEEVFNKEIVWLGKSSLKDAVERLKFEYDAGFGSQNLFGTIWYHDGTWSEREEYDGSEWWAHRVCPPKPTEEK